ncbi:hypothetical protein WJ973_02985 [Achromobacter xylosoxidans]
MSIFSRFFGRAESSADTVALTANPDMKDGPSLQVVFAAPLAPQADALAAALRAYHPEMREARAEIEPDMPELLALVGWGKHVVRLVGFNAPFPRMRWRRAWRRRTIPPRSRSRCAATSAMCCSTTPASRRIRWSSTWRWRRWPGR